MHRWRRFRSRALPPPRPTPGLTRWATRAPPRSRPPRFAANLPPDGRGRREPAEPGGQRLVPRVADGDEPLFDGRLLLRPAPRPRGGGHRPERGDRASRPARLCGGALADRGGVLRDPP